MATKAMYAGAIRAALLSKAFLLYAVSSGASYSSSLLKIERIMAIKRRGGGKKKATDVWRAEILF